MAKVLIVGSRRRRQGLGEFICRWFAEAGAEISAIVGTTEGTVAEARRTLGARYGIQCGGYVSLEEALEREQPRITALCSPYAVHRRQLELVAQAGAHCLCEKPLWWEDVPDRGAETARLVDLFADRGLYLSQVTQWPCTLPAFYEIYPQAAGQTVERFSMRLSPISRGPAMVVDAAPHVLSMLQNLAGCGRVSSPEVAYLDAESADLRIAFDYCHRTGVTAVSCHFRRCEKPPRPASYAINGMEVSRRVELPSYALHFEAGARRTRLEDPLKLLVNDFLKKVAAGRPVEREALVASITSLEILTRASQEGDVSRASECY